MIITNHLSSVDLIPAVCWSEYSPDGRETSYCAESRKAHADGFLVVSYVTQQPLYYLSQGGVDDQWDALPIKGRGRARNALIMRAKADATIFETRMFYATGGTRTKSSCLAVLGLRAR